MTYNNLMQDIFADEMGDSFLQQYAKVWNYSNIILDNVLSKDESAWYDDTKTPVVETKNNMLMRSFERAVLEWREMDGHDRLWGNLHTVTFKHPLGSVAPFKWFVNEGPFPLGSDGKGVWKAQYHMLKKPFAAFGGPIFRKVDDLSALSRSIAVLAGGQSGHWFQPHYGDQIPLWMDGAMRPCLFTREQVKDDQVFVLKLIP